LDGDYVIIHTHAQSNPLERGSAVMDIFRLEDGYEINVQRLEFHVQR